ncbi:serine/threonine-protein kinase [Oxynema aestuarii]|uniref:Serine/threonine protein kinase n=1 Tax=Oxynema aestuarii AP17 TaxID=2064643 RepID=A0A6H1TW41_9CYAN|nr:serine/threonine-protein kinase [Oxynema aestuarii]QIZ69973.1 serine/threonine protein kinase [Oxynema aestuarii AP17]
MSQFPDFTAHGYQIQRELGHNFAGGRVTYLARDLKGDRCVTLKQFQFARATAQWSAYQAHEREIAVLQQLDHPGIPRYLDSFATPSGFCLVQDYKPARSLAVPRSFDPEQIEQLVTRLLDILVYLQRRDPPVIHRDIKPENVLVDDRLRVYLVDFGFARFGMGEVAMSSMVKGTLGFMPPEQMLNRELTLASDLYGVGATTICLLTRTPSTAIADLLDEDYRIQFADRLPDISESWRQWLAKLVKPNPGDRFADALGARTALESISIVRTPQVQLQPQELALSANTIGQSLQATISVKNIVSKTRFVGRWQVRSHRSDTPLLPTASGAAHPWIRITPEELCSNRIDCQIEVDTALLQAGRTYERLLVLHGNGIPAEIEVSLSVRTAPIPAIGRQLPYTSLFGLWVACVTSAIVALPTVASPIAIALGGFVTWAGLSKLMQSKALWMRFLVTAGATGCLAAIAGFTLGTIAGATVAGAFATAISLASTMVTGGALLWTATGVKRDFGARWAAGLSLLSALSGMAVGIGLKWAAWPPLLLLGIAVTTLPVVAVGISLPIARAFRLARYRRSQQHLIGF